LADKKLRIGWIVPTVGTFGAVREMVEVSNELVLRGHTVTIYHPEGTPCKWLRCLALCKKLQQVRQDRLDILIGIVDWKTELYQDLLAAKATHKAICLLGFEPTTQMAEALRGEREAEDRAQKIILDAMQRKFLILTDSSWQIEWMQQNVGYPAGPSFGGINLRMFTPLHKFDTDRTIKIIYSGDPRERKGTDTVKKAIEIIKEYSFSQVDFDFYWGKRYNQDQLVAFIQRADIFLDGHRRAGWCNPVAEAIACGVVPVCTRIGANQDFALHEETALLVNVDDAEAMANEAVRLIMDRDLRVRLRKNGLLQIQKFSYAKIAKNLETVLLNLS